METILFNVTGMKYRPKKVFRMADEEINSGDELFLERDIKNEYDEYAVKVFYFDTWIGYVESNYSQDVSELLESDKKYSCKVFDCTPVWDMKDTDSGRVVEYIKDVDLLAEITIEEKVNL